MMDNEIRYDGHMTDLIPAWAWEIGTRYAQDPFQYRKVDEYIKLHHGRKHPKIYMATINNITKIQTNRTEDLPKLHVMNLDSGENSDNGARYMIKTTTYFTVEEIQYRIEQEITVYISSIMSGVQDHRLSFYVSGQDIPRMEID